MLMQKKDMYVHIFLGSIKNNMPTEKGKYSLRLRKVMEKIYHILTSGFQFKNVVSEREKDQRKSWLCIIDL